MNPLKILQYGRFFTPAKFAYFITHVGKSLTFLRKAVVLFYCMKDKDTPKYVKALIVGGLGYLILPTDAIPDTIVGLGWLDDVAVLATVMKVAEKYIKPEHRVMAQQRIPFGHDE